MRAAAVKPDTSNSQFDAGHVTRHRMAIFAASAADAVRFTGGLIFDHVGAGWDVKVFLASETPDDELTLRILGIRQQMQPSDISSSDLPDLMLAGTELFRTHPDVRRLFKAAARKQHTEIAMWGGEWPDDLDQGTGTVQHSLSTAARAFKTYAETAAQLEPLSDPAEQFISGKRRLNTSAPLLQPA